MKNVFTKFTIIYLFSIGMVAFAGTKAGRLEITGNSEFLLNPISEVDYEFDNNSSYESEESGYDLELGLNYFLADSFSIGFGIGYEFTQNETKTYNAAGNLTSHDEEEETMYNLFLRGNYYFVTTGRWAPYAGVHAGYLFGSVKETDKLAASETELETSGYMYGAQVGMKYFITDSIALDVSLRYSELSIDGSIESGSGIDFDSDGTELEAVMGISVFF